MPPNSTWEEDASQPLSAAGSSSILSIARLVDASLQSLSPTPLSGSSSIIIWLLCVFGGVHRLLRALASLDWKVPGFQELLPLGSRRGLSIRGTQAWFPHAWWAPPGPGTEPVSPALAGGRLTSGPQGSPQVYLSVATGLRCVPGSQNWINGSSVIL